MFCKKFSFYHVCSSRCPNFYFIIQTYDFLEDLPFYGINEVCFPALSALNFAQMSTKLSFIYLKKPQIFQKSLRNRNTRFPKISDFKDYIQIFNKANTNCHRNIFAFKCVTPGWRHSLLLLFSFNILDFFNNVGIVQKRGNIARPRCVDDKSTC